MLEKYFKILGIKPTGSLQEIKAAYRKQMFLWHPDRMASSGVATEKEANERSVKIIEAYHFLEKHVKPVSGFEGCLSNVNEFGDPVFIRKSKVFQDTPVIDWSIREKKESSNIEWIEYYPKLEILLVGFRNGSAYLYEGVPVVTVREFNLAPSKGKFLNAHIAHSFQYHSLGEYSDWFTFARRIYDTANKR